MLDDSTIMFLERRRNKRIQITIDNEYMYPYNEMKWMDSIHTHTYTQTYPQVNR